MGTGGAVIYKGMCIDSLQYSQNSLLTTILYWLVPKHGRSYSARRLWKIKNVAIKQKITVKPQTEQKINENLATFSGLSQFWLLQGEQCNAWKWFCSVFCTVNTRHSADLQDENVISEG